MGTLLKDICNVSNRLFRLPIILYAQDFRIKAGTPRDLKYLLEIATKLKIRNRMKWNPMIDLVLLECLAPNGGGIISIYTG